MQPRNTDKLQSLIGYLQKHEAEIINYERRKKAGKTIGSGRAEKGIDRRVLIVLDFRVYSSCNFCVANFGI